MVKNSLCVFFILSAYTENTRKVFKHLWRMSGKYLSVFEEYAEILLSFPFHFVLKELFWSKSVGQTHCLSTCGAGLGRPWRWSWARTASRLLHTHPGPGAAASAPSNEKVTVSEHNIQKMRYQPERSPSPMQRGPALIGVLPTLAGREGQWKCSVLWWKLPEVAS